MVLIHDIYELLKRSDVPVIPVGKYGLMLVGSKPIDSSDGKDIFIAFGMVPNCQVSK